MWIEVILFFLALCVWLYHTVTKQFSYFESKGVPCVKPSFPFGSRNCKLLVSQQISFNNEVSEVAEKEMKDSKIFGYFSFGQPIWVINDDEELAKHILIKDFDHFTDTRRFATGSGWSKHSKISNKMFINMRGEEWRKNRSIMSGVFTSGKLKANLPLVNKSAHQLDQFLKDQVDANWRNGPIDSKEVSSNFALDAFAMSGFGLDCNSFENKDSTFRRQALTLIGQKDYDNYVAIRFLLVLALPKLADLLGATVAEPKSYDYFINLVENTYKQRKATGERQPDIIGLVVDELTAAEQNGERVDEKEIVLVAHAIILFFAGYNTISSAFTICVHHLLKHPEIQDKIFDEIREVFQLDEEYDFEKDVTYDDLMELKFLDQVMNECFRLNTFMSHSERLCTKDYKIPGTDLIIEKGRYVKCYVRNFAKRTSNFKNPDEFDPENFAKENNPDKFGVHFFGHGPRGCFGKRYAAMVLKMAVLYFLRRYKMVPCDRTVNEVMYSKQQFFGVDGILFKLEPRN